MEEEVIDTLNQVDNQNSYFDALELIMSYGIDSDCAQALLDEIIDDMAANGKRI